MTAQALYRKWRPRTFEEIVGQQHVVRTLRNALISGRIHHAYLFAGPRGTGKTTTARLLAKAVNCLAPKEERPCNECEICVAVNEGRLLDLIEIDAASNTGVDDVRELRERVGFRPNEARYKVYVIDEVHMLSNAAFNALLKTLEEPPEHAIFVLATTEPHKILPTVLSRCQRFDFHRISVGEIVDRLEWLAGREGLQFERQALELIARQATGSMRDAESLLDQLASYDGGRITIEQMRTALGIGASETVMQITDALGRKDVAQGLDVINAAVDKGMDPRQFARQMVEHLRALLLLKLGSRDVLPYISEEMLPSLQDQAAAFSRRQLVKGVQLFNEAAKEAKGGWQPQLPLEMAFIEAVLMTEPVVKGDAPSATVSSSASSRHRASRSVPANTPSVSSDRSKQSRSDVEKTGKPNGAEQTSDSEVVRDSATAYEVGDGDDGLLTTELILEQWSRFLNALRPRDLSLEALMRSCEPVGVENDVVVLSFSHKFHRSKVEEDKKRGIVEDVLSDVLGRRLRIRCVINKHRESHSSREVAEQVGEGGGSESLDVSDDPVVQMAVNELGAEVVSG
jgi:DNA polymerase-3 subunit gamma/tau